MPFLTVIDVEIERKRNSDIADYVNAVITASRNDCVLLQEDFDLAKDALVEAIESYCVKYEMSYRD